MKFNQKPHTCPCCMGTGEEQYDLYTPVDDMTQVSYNEDLETSACTACGGEGIVYERIRFNDELAMQDDFVNDEWLETLAG
jgi:hypothetical protein